MGGVLDAAVAACLDGGTELLRTRVDRALDGGSPETEKAD
jgi:hypothetical protein